MTTIRVNGAGVCLQDRLGTLGRARCRGPDWREFAGTFGWADGGSVADGRRQPCQGATELAASAVARVRRAERTVRPGRRTVAEGSWWSDRPAITCTASQAPYEPREVSNGVLPVVGLQFQGLSVPVGDEAVIAVGGEEASWEPGVGFTRRTMLRSHIGGAVHPVGDRRPVCIGTPRSQAAASPTRTRASSSARAVVQALAEVGGAPSGPAKHDGQQYTAVWRAQFSSRSCRVRPQRPRPGPTTGGSRGQLTISASRTRPSHGHSLGFTVASQH